MASGSLGNIPASAVPKHRACDECRARKLACSKETDGCARCRKEGIQCHYSPQKPMGRPRKRRPVDEWTPSAGGGNTSGNSSSTAAGPASSNAHGILTPPIGLPGPQHPAPLSGYGPLPDSSIDFFPQQDVGSSSSSTNMAMFDMMAGSSSNDCSGAYFSFQPYHHDQHYGPGAHLGDGQAFSPVSLAGSGGEGASRTAGGAPTPASAPESAPGQTAASGASRTGSSHMSGLEADEADAGDCSPVLSNNLFQRLEHSTVLRPLHHPSHLPPGRSSTAPALPPTNMPPTNLTNMPPNLPPPNLPPTSMRPSCACLSSLCLALESLARLPPDVASAMRVARGASKVAHDAIDCRQCYGALLDDPLRPPPVQNLMCLGSLVPSTCSAYATILDMIDADTATARRHHRTLYFSLKDIGGLWGFDAHHMASADAPLAVMRNLDCRFLDPDTWRQTMRAVLRLDLEGVRDHVSPAAASSPQPRGLRHVFARLDETWRSRHSVYDSLPKHSPQYLVYPMSQSSCPPEQRNCAQVIDAARMALDKLVIP